MSIRPTRSAIWLLLALLALRGLVPTGYMVEANADGLSIVVCGSGIYAAAAQQTQSMHAGHAGHGQHHHEGGGDHSSQGETDDSEHPAPDHSICPFAIAAVGAPSADPFGLDAHIETATGSWPFMDGRFIASFGPSRAQQPRAPPHFS